jgi:hypothetical protein
MIIPTKTIPAVIATCAALVAVPAAAVDGEILIDQAKVKAGGITLGDDPGFPATLSKPGRYTLSGNLVVPAGSRGIEVTAHDVTIDLNGFTMRSNPPGQAGDAIDAGDFTRLRVVNGTVTGFGGAAVRGGASAVVENLRAASNGTGIAVGQQSRIGNSTIAGGIGGVSCGQCLVEQSVIAGNTGNGVTLSGGQSVVLGNVIVGNGSFGMTSVFEASGYGANILIGNNGGGEQVTGTVASQFHPNYCAPACP